MSATYAKLKDESWGVKIVGVKPSVGQTVTVKKKDGSTSSETITHILWSSPDGTTHLCKIGEKEPSERKSNRYVCAECGKGGTLVQDLEDGLMKHYQCCDIPPGGY